MSMGFSRQEYWSGLPFHSPGDLSDPEIKPIPPALAGRFFTVEPPGKSWGDGSLSQMGRGKEGGVREVVVEAGRGKKVRQLPPDSGDGGL